MYSYLHFHILFCYYFICKWHYWKTIIVRFDLPEPNFLQNWVLVNQFSSKLGSDKMTVCFENRSESR